MNMVMNEMKKRHCGIKHVALVALAALFCGTTATAQIKEKRAFATGYTISDVDNTTFCISFLSQGRVYTLRDIAIADVSSITDIAFNPTGSSLAILRGKNEVAVYSFTRQNGLIAELKEERKSKELKARRQYPFSGKDVLWADMVKDASKGRLVNLSACYAPDARRLVVSNSLGELIIYDTKEYLPQAYLQGNLAATSLAVSANNYFVAAAGGKNIEIWNLQQKKLRTTIPFGGEVIGVDFSDDSSQLAVSTNDGRVTIIDTKNWSKVDVFDKLGSRLSAPSFHPEGKYVSVVGDEGKIQVLNIRNHETEQVIEEPLKGVKTTQFFKNNLTSDVIMISNRPNAIVFWNANGLNPFYGKAINKEVDAKMNEWVKMMQGESMDDYAIRVNDETRLKQQALFEQEAATRMAGDRIAMDNPFVGDYNMADSKLNIGFKSMPSIAVEVPAAEAATFGTADNLKFENAVYVINDKDEFELAYVEVRNETTNKVYIYDNIGRTKLTALEADDNFVPLEVMQLASREEVQLKEIKEAVIEEKKQEKLITENTQIDVKTEVIPGVDADGNKILNYKVGYKYEVINKAFSAKEDFPSGGYDIERSNAAMSLMKIIKNAFEGDFSKYLAEGKQVKVVITGSADASPIRGNIRYTGQYGEFTDEPYYKDGNLDNISVTKAGGITSNEQLALLRAAGVKSYIENNVTTLGKTRNEYEYHVEVAKERGGEFRKINVEFVIMDAFPAK